MADSDLRTLLGAETAIYRAHQDAWKRDEARLYGADAVLPELDQWKGESATFYQRRQRRAHYVNFPKLHASVLTGHLAQVRPVPGAGLSFGTLGEIRPTQEIQGRPSIAEAIYYNVAGIGNDANEWPAWTDGVQERACATGFRWTLVEMPALGDVRTGADSAAPATEADVRNGFRPYLVEFSPLAVRYWEIDRGRLDCAILRVPMRRRTRGVAEHAEGYYLLVREGFTGLGDSFAAGGWWLYDSDQRALENGRWANTRGQIPLAPLLADDTPGTWERPALARSLTMELGQLAVGLMTALSERDYNASQAAKAITYILGANPRVDATTGKPEDFNLTVQMHEDGALIVPVFAYEDGKGAIVIPQLWNSSAAVVPAEVYESLVKGKFDEAREIMVRAVSGPASSGAARAAEFQQEKSPLLARLAGNRQRWEQTLIWFLELRAGAPNPTGFSAWPREFDLAPVVDDIDAMLETVRVSGLSSPTLAAHLVTRSAKERDLLGDDATEETVRRELLDSAARAQQDRARTDDLLQQFARDGNPDLEPEPEPEPEPAGA